MALGLFSMGTPVGTMVGLAVGGLASQLLTWRQTFVGAGAAGLVVALLFMLFVPSADALVKQQADRRVSLWATLTRLFQSPAYRWLFAGLCLTGIGFVSDVATNAGLSDGLRWGLFVIPIALALVGSALLVAAVRVIRELSARSVLP